MTLPCLTVCQPYAHYSIHGVCHGERKRVENRTWRTNYRGWLAIHAGKSRKWLGTDDKPYDPPAMVFGAVIGLVKLVAIIRLTSLPLLPGDSIFISVRTHRHAAGRTVVL